MKKFGIIIILIIFNLFFRIGYSQNISFMNNYLGNVLLFDSGKIKQIEHLPLKSYQIGNKSFAYEDNAGNLKIYYEKFIYNLSNFTTTYKVSDNLSTFSLNSQLKIFDNGNIKTLSIGSTQYSLGDDVIIWFDNIEKLLKAYYNEQIFVLDDALATGKSQKFEAVENVGVFYDSQGFFNVFYEGNIEKICNSERLKSYRAGRNIVAYVEEPVNIFRVFYFGEIIDLESFEPVSYKTGDDFVVYEDANNYLKIFKDFRTTTLSFDNPDFYEAHDDIVVFGVQNNFKVYCNGNVYNLESYIPDEYKFNNTVLAYKDQLGNLKFFDGNKLETISYEKIKSFDIHGSIVKFKYGVNSESIYYQSKLYNND